ncbi:MAG: transcription termination/antitermination protein NusG [Puniceicoccales bacterium]
MPLIPLLSEEPNWFCLRAQPRRERPAVGTLLTLPNVEPFLPIAKYSRQNAKGKRQVREPIFPGYLFCRFIPAESARQVQYSQGVAYIIKRGEHLVSIDEALIEELRLVAPEGVLELMPRPLHEGEQVRLIHGIFAGSNAEVVELVPAADRVKVLLEILGNEQEIVLPVSAIERHFENPLRGD